MADPVVTYLHCDPTTRIGWAISRGPRSRFAADPNAIEVALSPSDDPGLYQATEDWTAHEDNPAAAATRLTSAKSAARARIEASVRQMRLQIITDLPGQEMVYLVKREEATACLALGPVATILPGTFPLLEQEVGITAPTIREVAQVVVDRSTAWTLIAAATDPVRLQANIDIEAAASEAAVQGIVETAIPAIWAAAQA